MKNLKWLWIIALIGATSYTIYDYVGNGFNWRTIINLVIVVSSGVGLLNKK